MSVETLVSDISKLPITKLVGTPDGMDMLGNSPDMLAAVQAIVAEPELNKFDTLGLEWVGKGDYSHVWFLGDTALKLSTHTTNRDFRNCGEPGWPENLIGQFTFMTALGHRLQNHGDGSITTPGQHFALRTQDGRFLAAQQYMDTCVPLHQWQNDRGYTNKSAERKDLDRAIRERVIDNLGSTLLRIGTRDLLEPTKGIIQNANVLLPAEATDAATAPLYVIDQPSRGIAGKVAVQVAGSYLKRQAIPINQRITRYI